MKKADNFDVKQWLTENKITTQSRLNEIEAPSNLNPITKKKFDNLIAMAEKAVANKDQETLYKIYNQGLRNDSKGWGYSPLKKAIVPPLGYTIVGADLSNIELRVGLAFAGQEDKLKMLGDGLDLYKDFVAPIFNVAYDDVNEGQRFIGKTSQL